MTELHLIVAHARNGAIGKEGKLPWYLPEDLKHFKRTTLGKPVIMGRKTWETLGKPLPGRKTIVVTRKPDYVAEGAVVVHSIDDAVTAVGEAPIAFIMGGADLYAQTLNRVQVAHVTVLNADFDGDAFFKPLSDDEWFLADEQTFPATDSHPFSYSFRRYERKH